jgi:hypothetical protein
MDTFRMSIESPDNFPEGAELAIEMREPRGKFLALNSILEFLSCAPMFSGSLGSNMNLRTCSVRRIDRLSPELTRVGFE